MTLPTVWCEMKKNTVFFTKIMGMSCSWCRKSDGRKKTSSHHLRKHRKSLRNYADHRRFIDGFYLDRKAAKIYALQRFSAQKVDDSAKPRISAKPRNRRFLDPDGIFSILKTRLNSTVLSPSDGISIGL